MLRIQLKDGTIILGLTQENIDRLIKGLPMAIDTRDLRKSVMDVAAGPGTVIICYGKTDEDVQREIEKGIRKKLPPGEVIP